MKMKSIYKVFIVVSSVAPLLQADGTADRAGSSQSSTCVFEGFVCGLQFQHISPKQAHR